MRMFATSNQGLIRNCLAVCGVVGLSAWLAVGVTGQDGKAKKADEKAAHAHEHEAALPKRGVCVLVAKEDSKVAGVVEFMQEGENCHLVGEITGLTPGEHGFHIHEFGDLRDPKGMGAGSHFNPKGHKHGAPGTGERHVGDLGNVKADDKGVAKVDIKVEGLSLHFVLGRSLVVHAKPDDFSQPVGNAGPRVGVGVIAIAAEPKKEEPKK